MIAITIKRRQAKRHDGGKDMVPARVSKLSTPLLEAVKALCSYVEECPEPEHRWRVQRLLRFLGSINNCAERQLQPKMYVLESNVVICDAGMRMIDRK